MKYISYAMVFSLICNISIENLQANHKDKSDIIHKEIIFDVKNRLLNAKVNSSKITLKVDIDFIDGRILNKSTAKLLGLKRSLIGGGVRIGNIVLNADSSKRPFSILDMPETKSRLHWFDRDIAADADGLISATSLPFENIVFQLRGPESHDEKADIPLKKPGSWGFAGGYGILMVDDNEVRLGFALERPETIISADLGALLMQSNGGSFEGDIVFKDIRYGVTIPMRLAHFTKPIHIGSLAVTSAYIYSAEPERKGLDDGSLAPTPDEIVVTGKKRRSHLVYNISVGSNDLSRCASLTFKKAIGAIEMNCH